MQLWAPFKGTMQRQPFFITAVVLHRHSTPIAEKARSGAEKGVHGYVHNDYRSLNA